MNAGIAAVILVCTALLLILWFLRGLTKELRSAKSSVNSRLEQLSTTVGELRAQADSPETGRSPAAVSSVDAHWHLSYGHPGSNVDVSLCELPDIHSLQKLDLPETAQAHISDFVLDAAHLYGEASGVRSLAIRFSPEVARQLKNGQLELMKSALAQKPCAIDPTNGRIVELADIVSSINPVAAVAFAWQVLALITAKKFLADINSKLADIGKEVHEIRQFLIAQEESELIANYEYLQQVTASVLLGNLSPEDVIVIGTQLEDIERQSSKSLHVALKSGRLRIQGLKSELGIANREKKFEEFIRYSTRETESFSDFSRLCLVALAVRTAATYVRAALPLNKSIAKNRLTRIQDDLAAFDTVRSEFRKSIHALNETMKTRDWTWHVAGTFRERGKQKIDGVLAHVDTRFNEIQLTLERVTAALDESAEPTTIYAHISDNQATLLGSAKEEG